MRTIATLLLVAFMTSCVMGCATVRTTVKKDKNGLAVFEQVISARSSAAVELAGQKFEGSLMYNPATETYDILIESGQDAENVNATGMEAMTAILGAALAEIFSKGVATPIP